MCSIRSIFPTAPTSPTSQSGQEIGTPAQLHQVMEAYGVRHTLLVQPNSGYGSDNSCMLDAIARGNGRFKGIAIVPFDADLATLRDLQSRGVDRRGVQPDVPRRRLLRAGARR